MLLVSRAPDSYYYLSVSVRRYRTAFYSGHSTVPGPPGLRGAKAQGRFRGIDTVSKKKAHRTRNRTKGIVRDGGISKGFAQARINTTETPGLNVIRVIMRAF